MKEIIFARENQKIFIVLEYTFYGSLDPILKKGNFSESFASIGFKQAIEDVKYLQQNKIAHHDIKTSGNILNTKRDKKIYIFIVFSHSKIQKTFLVLVFTNCSKSMRTIKSIIEYITADVEVLMFLY
jgi:serine/threonine protein kinase